MQTYAEAKLSQKEGRDLWLSMHHEVEKQHLMAPSFPTTALKLSILFIVLGVALWTSWFAESLLDSVIAWAILALLLAQFAFVGHDAGHGSIARKLAANRIYGQIAMTFVTGLAFDEWIRRHRLHHKFCQDEAHDPDMAIDTVASLTEKSTQGKNPLGRFMTRHQAIHIWMLALFFGHSQRHLSQATVLATPDRYPFDSMMLLMHFSLWIGLPCWLLDITFTKALLTYTIPATLLGLYFSSIFWVNHIGMPLIRNVDNFSFLEHQIITSRTIINPPALDWVFGGLNLQIEHHLFPRVPSYRLRQLQVIVMNHCARHSIPYQGVTWLDAVRQIAAHLRHVARSA